ncbi:14781_t:CDS:2 [Gigaspora rosea]|nr:14781_t:CDS:2 [Gigaspora rosea]
MSSKKHKDKTTLNNEQRKELGEKKFGLKIHQSTIGRLLRSKDDIGNNLSAKRQRMVHSGLVDQYISYEYSYYTPPVAKLEVEEVFHKTSNPELVEASQKEINKVLDVYEKLLNGKEYLNREFSLADLLYIPFTYLFI